MAIDHLQDPADVGGNAVFHLICERQHPFSAPCICVSAVTPNLGHGFCVKYRHIGKVHSAHCTGNEIFYSRSLFCSQLLSRIHGDHNRSGGIR